MKVTVARLATYIERDGWKRIPGAPAGMTRYGATVMGSAMWVDVPDDRIPELDRERDKAYARERNKVQRRANGPGPRR